MHFLSKVFAIITFLTYIDFAVFSSFSQDIFDCQMTVSCYTEKPFEVSNKNLFNCSEGSIFWSYPMSNMTMIFTYNGVPFQFCLTNTNFIYDDMPLYRIINEQELKIDIVAEQMCFNSDKNNTVILKSVGPTSVKYYGEMINFRLNSTQF